MDRREHRSGHTIALNAGLALAYLVLAQLGQWLQLSPQNINLFGPAAALAFCVILYFGYRLWPGIFIGALLNYLLLSHPVSGSEAWQQFLWSGASIAAAATAQALVSAFLVNRYTDVSGGFIHQYDILRVLVYGGPVGSLLGSLWGSLTLGLIEHTSREQWLFNWLSWWASDSLLIVATLPLLFIALARPRQQWKQRGVGIAIPVLGALSATLLIHSFVANEQRHHIEAEFREKAYRLSDALEKRLLRNIEVLYSVQNLFNTGSTVQRAHFDSFVQRSLERNPGIQALGWNPVVSGDRRAAFEQAMQAEGFTGFRITERNRDGELVSAGLRERHVTVKYLVPLKDNEKALGYDIYSNPLRRQALDQAISSGKLVATAPIRLVQETGNQSGVLFILPVYTDTSIPPFNQRDDEIRGFTVGVYRLGDLVSQALNEFNMAHLAIRVRDATSANYSEPLAYFEFNADGDGRLLEHLDSPTTAASLAWQATFGFGQRDWQFLVQATPGYLLANRSWTASITLAIGLVFSALIGGFALIITGRNLMDLATMDALGREIKKRKQVEDDLQRANRELQTLATTDALTGINNRRSIESIGHKIAAEARRYGEPYSVLMIDIDHFKAVNDEHGHRAGDRVLQQLIGNIRQQLRDSDDIGRWGGEEFVIIARRIKHNASVNFARRLVNNVANLHIEPVGQITISVGVASAERSETFEQVLNRADLAMYQAKEGGRNRVVVNQPDTEEKSATMVKLEPR